MNHEEIGSLHLKILGKHFSKTSNDIRSRLFSTKWYETHHLLHEAQNILREFIDQNPRDPSTPRFIYTLAQQMRRQGIKHYPQALHHLESIATDYPDSEFYVPARLLSGELLRELHHFFGAQLLYEDLLKKLTLAPHLKAWVQLLRIRCILALHPHEHLEQEKAISLLSSIADISQLPQELHAEIQFMQILLLFENRRFPEAKQITHQVVSDFMTNTSPAPKQCYWIKRMLQIAQCIAKEENDISSQQKLHDILKNLPLH
jgi:tetratricopeptide (TPR) repeat protein